MKHSALLTVIVLYGGLLTAQVTDTPPPPPPTPPTDESLFDYDGELIMPEVEEEEPVYTIVEQMPAHKSCEGVLNSERESCTQVAIINEIQKNIQILKLSSEEAEELPSSRVYVSFVVSELGNIEQVKLLKGSSEKLNQSALKAVSQLSPMIPGKQRGRPVKVRYTIPIKFSYD